MKKKYFYILSGLVAIILGYIIITDGITSFFTLGLGFLAGVFCTKSYSKVKAFIAKIFSKIKGEVMTEKEK